MEAHQKRVVKEKKELDAKIEALLKFIHQEDFNELCPGCVGIRMRQQFQVMEEYSNILAQRIVEFS